MGRDVKLAKESLSSCFAFLNLDINVIRSKKSHLKAKLTHIVVLSAEQLGVRH